MQPSLDHTGKRPPDYHLPCPRCASQCKTIAGRNKKTVGVWEDGKGGRRTWCIRCQAKDRDRSGRIDSAPSPQKTRSRDTSETARWLWSQSKPLQGSLGEIYLREQRGLNLQSLPATMRFLPANGQHKASIITAFGLADGTDPSDLELEDDVTAVHLTKLDETGAKLNKIMLGAVSGQPLCLAPLNDACGLAITEGIEDALSVHLATGLGAWAAGSARHLEKLSKVVSSFTQCVSVIADTDPVGRQSAKRLVQDLNELGFETFLCCPGRNI